MNVYIESTKESSEKLLQIIRLQQSGWLQNIVCEKIHLKKSRSKQFINIVEKCFGNNDNNNKQKTKK